MNKRSLLLLLLFSSCYSPDLSGVRYTCSDVNPICPNGLTCIAGICQEPGQGGGAGDGGDGTTDGGTGGGDDLGSAPPGCKAGQGTQLGASVFACAGKFDPGHNNGAPSASELCNKAAGYAVCTSAMLGGANLMTCKGLSGFFVSQSQASLRPNDYNPAGTACYGPANSNWGRLLLGCGRSASSIYDLSAPCDAATQALDCRDTSDWNCQSAGQIDDARNDNPADGVLCCK